MIPAGMRDPHPPEAAQPNAELHGFEPLRVALALGALLLGLAVSLL